jgi:hypothetical protein
MSHFETLLVFALMLPVVAMADNPTIQLKDPVEAKCGIIAGIKNGPDGDLKARNKAVFDLLDDSKVGLYTSSGKPIVLGNGYTSRIININNIYNFVGVDGYAHTETGRVLEISPDSTPKQRVFYCQFKLDLDNNTCSYKSGQLHDCIEKASPALTYSQEGAKFDAAFRGKIEGFVKAVANDVTAGATTAYKDIKSTLTNSEEDPPTTQ